MRETGLDKLIKRFVKNDVVYVGLSVGSYLACPTIEAATWKPGDKNFVGLKNLKSLNFVPFLITAHFDQKYHSLVKEEASKSKYPVIALTDEQAVVVKNGGWKLIGRGRKNVYNLNLNKDC